ncbi:J domain-containing protein [Hymenobacter sp. BT730]|uniref:J domain-containing protein n=1 Tax=Hymenobacter sp. BT730 TaxID=3063332 RepID=UPI0026E09922|nr:J domain-containing protein [Hymenobacter sp. BT730]
MSYYHTLGIPTEATPEEIRLAYRRLVLMTHPDRTKDTAAHQRFLAINEAYETLSQPTLRAAYDAKLRRPHPPVAEHHTVPHPDPALRRRGFRRARPAPRAPLPPLHIRYAAEFKRALPQFRKAAKLSLLGVLLVVVDFNRNVRLPNETIQEFTYVARRSRSGGGSSYFLVYTQNTDFRTDATTDLEVGDQLSIDQTPWFGKVKAVKVHSGKMRGYRFQIADFSIIWVLSGAVAASGLLLLGTQFRPDYAFNIGFTNIVLSIILLLYMLFV